eukprot:5278082-Pyramimonas_sp.AAC.1
MIRGGGAWYGITGVRHLQALKARPHPAVSSPPPPTRRGGVPSAVPRANDLPPARVHPRLHPHLLRLRARAAAQ